MMYSLSQLSLKRPSKRFVCAGNQLPRLLGGLGLALLVGCATVPEGTSEKSLEVSSIVKPASIKKLRGVEHLAMVEDLLSQLPQLFDPLNTTIQVGPISSPVERHASEFLAGMGYGVQLVDADQGQYFLTIDTPKIDPDGFQASVFQRLSVGAVELSREYAFANRAYKKANKITTISGNDSDVVPIGSLKIAGTRAPIVVDDSRFGEAIAQTIEGISAVEYSAAEPIMGGIPTISLITPELVEKVASNSTSGPTLQALNSSKVEINNLFYGGDSAFSSIYDDFERIGREIVVFPNDSMRLGSSGKKLIRDIIERFSENSDVFSLVGCSNGPTALAIGNEGLALGRANRITDEMLALGVPREKIFDEGCWSSESVAERYPGRGVVVDLWRKKG